MFLIACVVAASGVWAWRSWREMLEKVRRGREGELKQLSSVFQATEASKQMRGPVFEKLALELAGDAVDSSPTRIEPTEVQVLGYLGRPDFIQRPLPLGEAPKEWAAVGWKRYVWLCNSSGQRDAAVMATFKLDGKLENMGFPLPLPSCPGLIWLPSLPARHCRNNVCGE
jgi:hypothetical protein